MKIILSRKGFDSSKRNGVSNGNQPNPILPDGTMLSLPIPDKQGNNIFSSLHWKDLNYYDDIIHSLRPKTAIKAEDTCHLDPDLRKEVKDRLPDWKPAFGQAGSPLSHLFNNNVGVGDLFLFFGWFRQTEYINGVLKYKKGTPDLHIIYGYMQVGDIIKSFDNVPDWLKDHPHVSDGKNRGDNNAIFLPQKNLSFLPNKKGCDLLSYREDRVLTKKRVLTEKYMSKSRWDLPSFFKKVGISCHPNPWRDDYFQSVGLGQEFVMEATPEILEWVKQIIQ